MRNEQLTEELEARDSTFVQPAPGAVCDGTTQTPEGVRPSTLYFSDRPQRIVGLFGRPLSPVSVAGGRRRERRRF